jgi:ABC-type multidrug transport system ATPase subunit
MEQRALERQALSHAARESADALVNRIRELGSHGAIVFAATHDFDYAARVATRAACVNRGRCRELDADPSPLVERYRAALAGDAA